MNPLIKLGIFIVEAMFVAGTLGSTIVLIWVGIEDIRTMVQGEDEEPT